MPPPPPDLTRVAHLYRLPDLLRLLAANPSGELVKSRIARDDGIPETSLPGYLDLLETLYLIHALPAWGDNLTKRVTARQYRAYRRMLARRRGK